ncbi:hypothetical protein OESDEN_19983 [Oesophagostomum dentatum]|uniref:Uncharacterized protein n=1 Tax=Oesophagostomum dentatum TaxID=61180 RepID=A0A0B1S4R4_OESDE|nr:hypothetical protein OESDEN_19983 [Oesophagostomum dentatum]
MSQPRESQGLPEAPPNSTIKEKLDDLDMKVGNILELLQIECKPVEAYRIGKEENGRSRLVKLVLPSR